MRVSAVGLCGSDRHWLLEGGMGDAAARASARARARVRGVDRLREREGERVAVIQPIQCGACDLVAAGLEHLCPAVRFAGHGSTDGALRTLLSWPERLVSPGARRRSPMSRAPSPEPLGVALHALDLGHVRPGAGAGVFGCGRLGLLLVAAPAHLPASPIVATDLLAHRVACSRGRSARRMLASRG